MSVIERGAGDLAPGHNLAFEGERVELAAAFRWTARLGLHEAVANHFSLAVERRRRRGS